LSQRAAASGLGRSGREGRTAPRATLAAVLELSLAFAGTFSLALAAVPLAGAPLAAAAPLATAAPRSAPAAAPPRAGASIVGGAPASIVQFPFQVALFDVQPGSPPAGFFCGGVIVDATHVATAAHCVAGSQPAQIAVQAGSTSLAPEAGSVRDPVRSIAVDSHYSPASSDFDVALLTLAAPLWLGSAPAANRTDRIAPVVLDAALAARYGNPNAAPAIVATASGWGETNPSPGSSPSYPADLRSVRLPLVDEATCEEQYALIEQPIVPTMICAGGGRARPDTCYGDSGGPLLVDRDRPARPPEDYVLIGLVDFGNGCAQPGYAGVYTRVADPEVMGFLLSGIGRSPSSVAAQAKHKKKRKKRHRRG
jgi:trypsin